jgi:hypothetical protein
VWLERLATRQPLTEPLVPKSTSQAVGEAPQGRAVQYLTEPAMPWQARGVKQVAISGTGDPWKQAKLHTWGAKKEKEQPLQGAPRARPAVYGSAPDEVGAKDRYDLCIEKNVGQLS